MLIVGVLVQTAVSWIRHRKVSPMLLTSAVLVLVFGGLTLWIHDAAFIKWKPTIVNWLFAGAFLVSQFMKGPDDRAAHDGRAREARAGTLGPSST